MKYAHLTLDLNMVACTTMLTYSHTHKFTCIPIHSHEHTCVHVFTHVLMCVHHSLTCAVNMLTQTHMSMFIHTSTQTHSLNIQTDIHSCKYNFIHKYNHAFTHMDMLTDALTCEQAHTDNPHIHSHTIHLKTHTC